MKSWLTSVESLKRRFYTVGRCTTTWDRSPPSFIVFTIKASVLSDVTSTTSIQLKAKWEKRSLEANAFICILFEQESWFCQWRGEMTLNNSNHLHNARNGPRPMFMALEAVLEYQNIRILKSLTVSYVRDKSLQG